MNIDDLRAAEQRMYDELFGGRPPGWDIDGRLWPWLPYDLSELPPDTNWDTWTEEARTLPGFASWDGHRLAMSEHERRRCLVEFARMLARLRQADADYDRTVSEAERSADRQAVERAQLAIRRRARRAMSDLMDIGPRDMRKAANLAVRCPNGCFVAGFYVRRPSDEGGAGQDLLLIARNSAGQHDAAWVFTTGESPGATPSLEIGCRHGHGRVSNRHRPRLIMSDHHTVQPARLPGSIWHPKAGALEDGL